MQHFYEHLFWNLQATASENLSGAAIWIFRRYSESSSLSAFYKIGLFKTSAKFLGIHVPESLLNKVADLGPEVLLN